MREVVMSSDRSLPIAVLIIGLEEREAVRLTALLDPDETRIAYTATADGEGLPFGAPDALIVNAAPGGDAVVDTVRTARRRWPGPTMLCVNVASSDDAITLLGAGADDVCMANAEWGVVAALMGAALRRARLTNEQMRIRFGDIVFDRESRRVWCAGREVAFTPREMRLFDILFQRAGRPVSADTLESFVWNDGAPTTSNSLAVYIGYLRRKLAGSRASVLETLRGSGYRLVRRD
ncbi:MAG: response regulator transcription factor [Gemmatimonadaceae bacterium]